MKLDDQTHARMPYLPPRAPDSHKGDFGRALVIGGSRSMSGAIALAGRSTLRSGAGLVTLAVPAAVQELVASFEPAYMTHGLPDENGQIAPSAADEVIALAENATVIALGPGLGRSPALKQLVTHLYRVIDKPMVIDADALVALAESVGVLAEPGGSRVLTPHPGEFERFAKERPEKSRRIEAAAELASRDSSRKTIVVLKGHQTVITDGTRFSLNKTGNPGMATGGSGDVLTGIITGLMCQGLEPFDAARLGTYLHGSSGDMAVESTGEISLIATDLIDYLPHAIQYYVRHQRRT